MRRETRKLCAAEMRGGGAHSPVALSLEIIGSRITDIAAPSGRPPDHRYVPGADAPLLLVCPTRLFRPTAAALTCNERHSGHTPIVNNSSAAHRHGHGPPPAHFAALPRAVASPKMALTLCGH